MCFHNHQRERKKKFPSITEERFYVVQLNVFVMEPPIQFSFRKLILKINATILWIAFSILILFLY